MTPDTFIAWTLAITGAAFLLLSVIMLALGVWSEYRKHR